MKKKISLLLTVFLAVAGMAFSCSQNEKIVLTASASTVQPGGSVVLSADVADVTYQLTAGESVAQVDSQGLITVSPTAAVGTQIKAVAKKDSVTSNTVQIIVSDILVTAITNARAEFATIQKGESVQLSCTVEPVGATQNVTWIFVSNSIGATISGNTLISGDATGTVIVMAQAGEKLSNAVTVEVVESVPLESITISPSTSELARGATVQLTATLLPTNTTERDYVWDILPQSIVSNGWAEVNDSGLVTIAADAPLETEFQVRAKREAKQAIATIKITEVSYFLNRITGLTDGKFVVKNTSTDTTPVIRYSVLDTKEGKPVAGMNVEFSIETGDDLIRITPLGESCLVNQIKHGEAKILVTLKDQSDNIIETDEIDVKSIKTPSNIWLPEYLEESIALKGLPAYNSNPVYTVGKNQPFDFQARILGALDEQSDDYGVCTDIIYTFEMLSGTPLGELGSVENGKISFNQTGKIKVTAKTNSGNTSDKERSVSQIFEVNEYQNFDNYEKLKFYLEDRNESGVCQGSTQPAGANLVITSKPLGHNTYSLVPEFILNGGFNAANLAKLKGWYGHELSFPEGSSSENAFYLRHIGITVYDRDVFINGNNHWFDFSKLDSILNLPDGHRTNSVLSIQGSDYHGHHSSLGYLAKSVGIVDESYNLNEAALTNPSSRTPQFTAPAPVINVNLNSIKFRGNMGVDGVNLNGKDFMAGSKATNRWGTHAEAVYVGYRLRRANFNLIADNLEIKNFYRGMDIHRAVSETYGGTTYKSKISNTKISDIYAMGIQISMSQIELHNPTFGFTGTGPVEAVNDFSTLAGMNESQNQKIIITGTYDSGPTNRGWTRYYQDFGFNYGGKIVTFHQLMALYFTQASLNENQTNHVYHNGVDAFMFSMFALNDPSYPLQLLDSAGILFPSIASDSAAMEKLIAAVAPKIVRSLNPEDIGSNYSEITFEGASTVPLASIDANGKNTTAKYIAINIVIDTNSLGLNAILNFGTAYVKNSQYVGP